jgi:(1->4)-alpha-D-glucan 1-alpha-D-glucosylmutase
MAKGFEDTTLYVYNRLISLNDVGCDPDATGLSVQKFHQWNKKRLKHHPHTLNATSTHDTKRSEDVRSRIHVLSEVPVEWRNRIARWRKENQNKKKKIDGCTVPDLNEEYLIYQTLIGAWPFSKKEASAFKERLQAYLVKAAKEAKVHTSWIHPNPDYERALGGFVQSILSASKRNRFLKDFLRFQKRVAFYGALNSLGQVLLKIASPGVPDFYQGTELWDFSLVDPDNRRPVDYEKRARLTDELKKRERQEPSALIPELLSSWRDGRIKLFLTYKALCFRRSQSDLFLDGDYIPIYASGSKKKHVFAFVRKKDGILVVAAVPRLLTKLVSVSEFPLGRKVWGRSVLHLPAQAPKEWLNVLTGETIKASFRAGKKVLPLEGVFQCFPVAFLAGRRA